MNMKTIILRYGELYLKGNNQGLFKKALANNIKTSLKGLEFNLIKTRSRYVVKVSEEDLDEAIERLKLVFGLVSFSVADEVKSERAEIEQFVSKIVLKTKTFRVSVNRADKTFPLSSVDFERHLGGIVLKNNTNAKVSLKNAETEIKIDIRETGKTYIFFQNIAGAGGLPLTTAGKGLLLLSGGIDSPVAGYQIAKRGLSFEALHFHSYPYTSDQAKQKVIKLAKLMRNYNPHLKLHFVSITKLQEEINKNCSPEYMIALMRRFMYRVAEQVAKQRKLKALITGENLGQVASQTLESLTTTNSVLKNTIALRPLLSFDKTEIIDIAKHLGTFETSILPYEDCCTVFLPKNPIIKPKEEKLLEEEAKLDLQSLLQESLDSLETYDLF